MASVTAMSSLTRPRGPLPRRVYWVRRVLVLGTALALVVGMRHFAMGATVMIEDYTQGGTRKMLVILVTLLAWAVAATGLFALARIAL